MLIKTIRNDTGSIIDTINSDKEQIQDIQDSMEQQNEKEKINNQKYSSKTENDKSKSYKEYI